MKQLLGAGVAFALAFQIGTAAACSICKSGEQFFFINNARSLKSGQLIFSLEHFNTRKSSGSSDHHEMGLAKFASPFGVRHGDEGLESQIQNSVLVSLVYGLSNRLMLMATVPYAFNRLSSMGESETANGLGDPEVMVLAHFGTLANGAITLQALAGTRAPVGQSDIKNESGQLVEQHLQCGTGAWSATFGFQASHLSGSVPLFIGVTYQINGTNNDHDFRYGNVLRYNLAVQKALVSAIDLIGEINGRSAAYDKEGSEQDPHSGGTVVYFSPGLRWRWFSALHLRTQVQIPIVEDLNGEQEEKINFRSGLVWTF